MFNKIFLILVITLSSSCVTKVIRESAPEVKTFPANQYQQPYNPYQYNGPSYNPYGNTAGSRFYSNPYAIPASPRYMRYDSDQYYVPPTYYNNNEYQQRSPFFQESTHF